jgi:hypothetical protein
MRHSFNAIVVVLAVTTGVAAQVPAAKPLPCGSAEHHQFDFWIGEWTVTTPDGKPAGHSRIEGVLGGCALLEHWSGAGGSDGKSLSLYVAADREWNQTWVDGGGNRIVLTGGLDGTRMVLKNAWTQGGKPMRSELSWTPGTDGSVRQVWRQSNDGGATWTTTFDGIYRRRQG